MNLNLFFATNRNHEGKNRWAPTGYGKNFSSDGHYNLRFGKLSITAKDADVSALVNKDFGGGRKGDGEGLSGHLTKLAKKAKITAYEDKTAIANEPIDPKANSSTRMFLDVKQEMEKANDVVVFIHGYNVTWEAAVGSALSLQLMLNRGKKADEKGVLVVLFSWPSDGSMMPFAAYKSDRSDARDSAQAIGRGLLKLRDFLGMLTPRNDDPTWQPCRQKIHMVCHSMGNFVLQNALGKLEGYSGGGLMSRIFENIFLCAADVDDDVLEKEGKMGRLHELSNHLSIYYNNGDVAMSISDYSKGNPQRLGHTGLARPQLVHNKIHQIDCSAIVTGAVEHSYYLWATVNDDIALTISGVAFDGLNRKRKRLANSREWQLM